MKSSWFGTMAGVVVFSLILCRCEGLVSLGMFPFMIITVALYLLLLITVLNIGQIARYLFSFLCRIGNGPIYVFPFVISQPRNGCIRFFFSLRVLIEPFSSYKVVEAYLEENKNTKLLRRYVASIWVQLVAKLLVGTTIFCVGLCSGDFLIAALGAIFTILIFDLANVERDDFVGEVVLCRKLKNWDSEFSNYYYSMQLALYFLYDRKTYYYFVDQLWDKVKRSSHPKRLADLLYCVYISSISNPDICICEGFNKDVQDILVNWIKGIAPASQQWWFINVYIIWAHYENRLEDLQNLISELHAEVGRINIPIACIKDMRQDVFDHTIKYAESGCISGVDSGKGKYKLLYKNVYCGISGVYFEAYKKVRNLIERN